MRRSISILLASVTLAVGCTGGGDGGGEIASSPAGDSGADDPALDDPLLDPLLDDSALDDAAYGQLLARIDEEGDTVDTALLRFALAFGPVDGVAAPAADSSVPHTGTGAVEGIERHWDELDDDQRLAVATTMARWLGYIDRDETLDGEGEGPGAVEAGDATTAIGVNLLAGSGAAPVIDEDVPDAEREEWEDRAVAAARWLRDQLPHEGPLLYELRFVEPDGGTDGAWATGIGRESVLLELIADLLGIPAPDIPPETCVIHLKNARTQTDGGALDSAMAHELFHCWSLDTLGLNGHIRTEGWVQEGLASWVGEMYVGGSAYSSGWWRYYLRKRATEGRWALFPTEYTAIGFWSAVDQLGGDLFERIPAIMRLSAADGDAGTYDGVMAGLSPEAQAAIGSTAALRPWGPAWNLVGPGVTGSGRQPVATPIEVGEQESWAAGIGQQVNRSYAPEAPSGDWFAVAVAVSGAGRFRWESGQFLAATGGSLSAGYCLRGPCVCESTGEPPPFELEEVAGDPFLATAITGLPAAPTEVTLQVLSENELCEEVECPDAPTLVSFRAGADEASLDAAAPDCITACPVGTWLADPASTEEYLLSLPGSVAAQASYESGSITVTFGQDWSFEQIIDDVVLVGSVAGTSAERYFSGRTTGRWTIQDGEHLLQITSVETTVETVVEGISTGSSTNTVDPSNLGGAFTFEPTCEGDDLELVADYTIPVPRHWRRVV